MTLYIVQLCTALYLTPTSTTPISLRCTPRRSYDTRQCAGEVTTSRDGKNATCEVNLHE